MRSIRINTELGLFELSLPEGLKFPDLDSKEYVEFREKLLKLIGAKK